MTLQLIVLDNPPLEHDLWATEVFKKAGLTVISNDKMSDALAKDPAAQKALLSTPDPVGDAEKLAPHYRRVFESLYGKEGRFGGWGTAWLLYAPKVDACVVDWAEVEKRSTTTLTGKEKVPYDHFRKTAHDFVAARVKKFLTPERYHELPLKLSMADRVEKTLAFLRQRSLLK